MKQLSSLFFLLFLLNGFASFAQMAEERAGASTLVIQGGTLIDGTGADPRENGTIVVRDNKILSVSRDPNQPAPTGARLVNARGKYVLPGLIDGHAHYASYAAQLILHYGITSVISTGASSPWIYAQRWAIEKGLIPGPRIYTSGNIIDGPPRLLGGSRDIVETADEARARSEERRVGKECRL